MYNEFLIIILNLNEFDKWTTDYKPLLSDVKCRIKVENFSYINDKYAKHKLTK
jgi:hypothetical protein